MLRLDPAHPPAWRDDLALQFGLDAVLVLDSVEPWQEILLHALETGIAAADAVAIAGGYGVDRTEAQRFLAQLRPVLRERGPVPRVHLDVAETFPHPVGADAAQILAADVDLVDSPDPGSTTLLLASHLVHPRRVLAAERRREAHLPVVVAGDRASIGPLLRPGAGPCLGCAAAHHRDADPAWPSVAAQLVGRPAAAVAPGFLAEALGLAVRMLSGRAGLRTHSHAVTIDARTLRRTWVELTAHPGCGCRSPEGTAIAAASPVRTLRPTRATAYARPA
jgi:bacteriocin biosynthesis cyclodehydratase domain-containing protein